MRTLICTKLSIPSLLISFLMLALFLAGKEGRADVRIKDIATVHVDREIDLLGYGLIIGLDGTGDGRGTQFTMQSLANMMQRMGLTVDPDKLKVKNVAAVIVTAKLSATHKVGDHLDVTVSSVGDATSLQGGMLLATPLSSPEGDVFVTAQGPVSIGGFNVQVEDGNKIINNYTLVGRVPGGGNVTQPLSQGENTGDIILSLQAPDYSTITRIAQKINEGFGPVATVVDAASVRVLVPENKNTADERARLIADIGILKVQPDQAAKVIINERTGTIVAGENVTIAPVAIAHGNITVSIKSIPIISQPEPFSKGETVVTGEYQISVDNEKARVIHLQESVSLADIASALNQIGAAPRDMIAIFESLKQAGALRAQLVII